MFIGVLRVGLYLSEPQSLKDKRRIIKSISQKLMNKFNIAVAETGNMDSWNNCELGIVCVSNEGAHADSMMSSAVNFIELQGDAEITSIETEVIPF